MILSIKSSPSIFLCLPVVRVALWWWLERAGYKMSMINEDLPDPDTPVTAVKMPRGKDTSIFFKLWWVAPVIFIDSFEPFLLFLGIGMLSLPDRYPPVNESGWAKRSLTVPCTIIFPPSRPARGPTSTTVSADSIVSSSCSTTITVLP